VVAIFAFEISVIVGLYRNLSALQFEHLILVIDIWKEEEEEDENISRWAPTTKVYTV
jgi:hypothetical protein